MMKRRGRKVGEAQEWCKRGERGRQTQEPEKKSRAKGDWCVCVCRRRDQQTEVTQVNPSPALTRSGTRDQGEEEGEREER